MKYYSQSGQDKLVANYYKNKKDGIFVDIGANDGITYSNTFFFEKELNWNGICIEPNPHIFKLLDENRKCIKIQGCISNKKEIVKFKCVEGFANMLSGMTDYYNDSHLKRLYSEVNDNGGVITDINVNSYILSDILLEHNMYNIDYMNIDTEGSEMMILKTIDFNKFNIKLLTVENNYHSIEQTEYIKNKGYKLYTRLEADEIFIKI